MHYPIKFYDVPSMIQDLEFDGDKSDRRLHYYPGFNWYESNARRYEQIEEDINSFEIRTARYDIYAWCDVSGYDYWVLQQEEPNYIQISVCFHTENIPNDLLPELEEDLDTVLSHFSVYEDHGLNEYYDKLARNEDE